MLDNPTYGNIANVTARVGQVAQTGLKDAYPDVSLSDLRLGFWVYVAPTSTSSSLLVRTSFAAADGWWYLEFHLDENVTIEGGRWTYVDPTAAGAMWRVVRPNVLGAPLMAWPAILAAANPKGGTSPTLRSFTIAQWEGSFSAAIDGVTVGDGVTTHVVDFESQPASSRPLLDGCKNDGWKINYPLNTYKNQGACVAAIVAAN